jgi:hypothetical protein
MATSANIFTLFGVGLRKSCQIALSRAVQSVQLAEGFNDDEMAEALGCERGTVRNVREQNTLLEFDKIVRLLGKYPDHCEEVRRTSEEGGVSSRSTFAAALGGWTEGLLAEGWRVRGYDIEEHEYGEERYPAELVLRNVLEMHGSEIADAS